MQCYISSQEHTLSKQKEYLIFNGILSEEDGYVIFLLCEFSISCAGFLMGAGQGGPRFHQKRHDASLHATQADGRARLDVTIILREPDGSRPASLSSSTRLCPGKTGPAWALLLVLFVSGL